MRRAESSVGVGHLSSFSRKRSGTKEAVQPSQLRKQSLVGSILDGWTTKVDIRLCVACCSLRRGLDYPSRPNAGMDDQRRLGEGEKKGSFQRSRSRFVHNSTATLLPATLLHGYSLS